jgi:Domain of unknown function (DUF6378)
LTMRRYKAGTVDATLAERAKVHGQFGEHSRVAQAIKAAMRTSPFWDGLADDSKEALEMVAHKAARILNGGEAHADNWHDMAGYAVLVERRVTGGRDGKA